MRAIIVSVFCIFFASAGLRIGIAFEASALTPEQHQSFQSLSKNLRCVTCPNQSLADSRAPVAESMREEIYEMVLKGMSEGQIKHYFVERYGEYVLYAPPFKLKTALLWMGPGILLMLGIGFMLRQLKVRENL